MVRFLAFWIDGSVRARSRGAATAREMALERAEDLTAMAAQAKKE